MRRILCIDGGGVKGAAIAEAVAVLERRLGKPIHEAFDLIVGTSVGAILGAIYAEGSLTAEQARTIFLDALPKVFQKRFRLPGQPKYSRKPVRDAFKAAIGEPTMAKCATNFVCTAVNACDSRTHFFKSWEAKDGALFLIDAVERSFAAPLYFGGIVDEERTALWLDGGTGADNCPMLTGITEAMRLGWFAEGAVHVLSLGCGFSEEDMTWEKAKKSNNFSQIGFFIDPADGGLARRQITKEKTDFASALEAVVPGYTHQRVDFPLEKANDGMDLLDRIPLYRSHGHIMGKSVDTGPLK